MRGEGAAKEKRRRKQSGPGGTGVEAGNQGEPSTPLSSAPGGTGGHRRSSAKRREEAREHEDKDDHKKETE